MSDRVTITLDRADAEALDDVLITFMNATEDSLNAYPNQTDESAQRSIARYQVANRISDEIAAALAAPDAPTEPLAAPADLTALSERLTAMGWTCEIDSDGRRLIADRHSRASFLRLIAYASASVTDIPCTTYSDDGMQMATRLTPEDCQAIDVIRAYQAMQRAAGEPGSETR